MKDIGGMLLLPGKNKTITVSQGEPLLNLKKILYRKKLWLVSPLLALLL